jgi:chaperonin GroES
MTFRPLHDRVIIKRLKAEEKTASGIVLPGSAAEKPDIGEVIAIGNGKLIENGKRIPLELKVGDRVIFGKYSGQNIKIENNEVLVMREEDVMAIIIK